MAGNRQGEPEHPLRTRRPRTKRRDAIENEAAVKAAAREVFLRLGDDLTMADVAEEAGVSRGTVYATFASREALISELTVEAVEEFTATFREALNAEDPWQMFEDLALNPKVGASASARLLDPNAPDSPELRAQKAAEKALEELLGVLKDRGIVRADVTVARLAKMYYGIFTALREDPFRSLDEEKALIAILLRGIRA